MSDLDIERIIAAAMQDKDLLRGCEEGAKRSYLEYMCDDLHWLLSRTLQEGVTVITALGSKSIIIKYAKARHQHVSIANSHSGDWAPKPALMRRMMHQRMERMLVDIDEIVEDFDEYCALVQEKYTSERDFFARHPTFGLNVAALREYGAFTLTIKRLLLVQPAYLLNL